MARLQWNNVAAPNLAGTSQIIRNAGASFQDGLTRANEILSQYDLGQKEKNDNEILAKVAGLNSEEELASFLQSDAIQGRNISSGMRDTILGLRQNILDAGQTRANIGLTDANRQNILGRLGIAQAAEGRANSEYEYGVQQRNELNALTGATVDAVNSGRSNGFDFSKYATGGATRPDSFSGMRPEMQDGLAGLLSTSSSEIGEGLEVYSGFRSASIQADIVAKNMSKYGLGSRTDEWISDVRSLGPEAAGRKWRPIMREAGLTKFVAMPGGSKHQTGQAADLKWRGKRLDQAPIEIQNWVKQNAGRFGLTIPMAHEPWQVETVDARGGSVKPVPRRDALSQALVDSTSIPPDQAIKLLNTAYAAQKEGQTRIDAAAAAAAQERSAAAILGAVDDPTNLTGAAVTNTLLDDPTFTSADERLSAVQRADGLLAEDQPLGSILRPGVEEDAVVSGTVDAALRASDRDFEALPQTRMLERAGRFANNPTEGLIAELGLGADGEDPRTYALGLFGERADQNTLTTYINRIADNTGVTPEIAASAMAEVFNRDPFGSNRTDRRFDPEEVERVIREQMGPDAMTRYDDQRLQRDRQRSELEGAQLQYNNLRRQAAKYQSNGEAVPEALSAELSLLRTTIENGSTPALARNSLQQYIRQNGMAERLRSLDPNSADYIRAIQELESYIQIDPELDPQQKRLLLAAITG